MRAHKTIDVTKALVNALTIPPLVKIARCCRKLLREAQAHNNGAEPCVPDPAVLYIAH